MRKSIALFTLCVLAPVTALAQVADPGLPRLDTDAPLDQHGGYVTPKMVPYEGGDIPSTAKLVSRPNGSLIGTGVGLLATSYAGSLIYALSTCGAQTDCRGGSAWLYVPIVGPFITAATAPTSGGQALAAFDGGVQVLGAALAIAGVVMPKKFVMWQSRSASLTVTPTGGGGGGALNAGIGLTLIHL